MSDGPRIDINRFHVRHWSNPSSSIKCRTLLVEIQFAKAFPNDQCSSFSDVDNRDRIMEWEVDRDSGLNFKVNLFNPRQTQGRSSRKRSRSRIKPASNLLNLVMNRAYRRWHHPRWSLYNFWYSMIEGWPNDAGGVAEQSPRTVDRNWSTMRLRWVNFGKPSNRTAKSSWQNRSRRVRDSKRFHCHWSYSCPLLLGIQLMMPSFCLCRIPSCANMWIAHLLILKFH